MNWQAKTDQYTFMETETTRAACRRNADKICATSNTPKARKYKTDFSLVLAASRLAKNTPIHMLASSNNGSVILCLQSYPKNNFRQ